MSQNEPKKILIVEDDPDLQSVYEMILTMQGYRVATAINGIKALEAVKKSPPDLILLDVLMPEMDGRDFLRNLDQSLYPDMRIVVSSNLSDSATIDEMLSLGAHDHVLKSMLTPNVLIELAENQLTT